MADNPERKNIGLEEQSLSVTDNFEGKTWDRLNNHCMSVADNVEEKTE